jgi:membrane-associated phospholipid phosphatase
MRRFVLYALLLVFMCSPLSAARSEVSITVDSPHFTFYANNLAYNPGLDDTATAAALGALAMPGFLMLEDDPQVFWKVPAYYGAAVGTSFALKEVFKSSFSPPRPGSYQSYYQGTEEPLFDSFPSGHATLAATAAAFTAVVYYRSYPHSNLRVPVTFSVSVLSGSASGLRILSGSHHPKDVVAGLVLGKLVGGLFGYFYSL